MPDRSEKRVLFVSYLFPPAGGAGVQRALKFVKYLPDYGWNCSVLTAANPSAPLLDEDLERDVPESTLVRRCRTLELGSCVPGSSLLQPDPQVLWKPLALRAGLRLLRECRHDAIIATGPPFSSLLLGAVLSRKTGVPLVLDYRDEWGLDNDHREHGPRWRWAVRMQRAMQRTAIRQARVLLSATPSSALQLAQVADQSGARIPTTWIYAGFDPDDFPSLPAADTPRADYGHGTEMYRISFVGPLSKLSPIGPFVSGVLKLARERPELASRLELVVAGRRTDEQEVELRRLADLPCKVVRLPVITHGEAVRIMRESDSQLLLNADRPDSDRIVNAGTFECIAARRPIFAVAPDGDLWELIRDLPGTVLCQPCAEGAIAEALARNIERHAAGLREMNDHQDITQYDQRHLTGELAVLLDELISDPAGHTVDLRQPADRVEVTS